MEVVEEGKEEVVEEEVGEKEVEKVKMEVEE